MVLILEKKCDVSKKYNKVLLTTLPEEIAKFENNFQHTEEKINIKLIYRKPKT